MSGKTYFKTEFGKARHPHTHAPQMSLCQGGKYSCAVYVGESDVLRITEAALVAFRTVYPEGPVPTRIPIRDDEQGRRYILARSRSVPFVRNCEGGKVADPTIIHGEMIAITFRIDPYRNDHGSGVAFLLSSIDVEGRV